MKSVKQVVAVLVWCAVSVGCVSDDVKHPVSSEIKDYEHEKTKIEEAIAEPKKLVEIEHSGGMCVVGNCGNHRLIIYRNGDTVNIINKKIYSHGKLTESEIGSLILDIDKENFKNLKQKNLATTAQQCLMLQKKYFYFI